MANTLSQPRSLRGLALSPDGTKLFGGFIRGTGTERVRKAASTMLTQIIGNEPLPDSTHNANSPYTAGLDAAVTLGTQPKGIATDDRGFVYITLSDPNLSTNQQFRVFSSDLSTVLGTATTSSPNWSNAPAPPKGVAAAGGSVARG